MVFQITRLITPWIVLHPVPITIIKPWYYVNQIKISNVYNISLCFVLVLFIYLFVYNLVILFHADGTQFAPDVDKENKFYVFSPEICR